MASPKTRIAFDKEVSEGSVPAQRFNKRGSYVVLFYYGMDQNRTAVALKSLGQGPFSSNKGEVADWDRHSRTLVLTGEDGAKHSFRVRPEQLRKRTRVRWTVRTSMSTKAIRYG
jgi:hypothetical protein